MQRETYYEYPARMLLTLAVLLCCVAGALVALGYGNAARSFMGGSTAIFSLWVMGGNHAA